MRKETLTLIDGKWITANPSKSGQKVRETSYFDDGTFGVVEYVFELLEPVADMRITKRSFLKNRMSESEYVRIDLASYGQTESAAKIRRFMEMFRGSPFFDLALESNKDDLQLMEDLGLLDGEGRAAEILSPPVNEDEKWRG